MNVASWLKQARTKISPLDADLILLDILNQADRTWLVTHANHELSTDGQQKANQYLKRREDKEPLAYILGYKEFYGRKFKVTPDVLIPRPETEDVFDLIPNDAKIICDIGTGSGCIGITTKLEYPDKTVICSDVSKAALEVAKENAKALHADIEFVQSDLLEQITTKPDLIIANLPYVDPNWDWLDHQSLDYEPALALYASEEGLELINRLIAEADVKNIKYLILEADPCQHAQIINTAKKHHYKLQAQNHFILKFIKD